MKAGMFGTMKVSGIFRFVGVQQTPKLSKNNNLYSTITVEHQMDGGFVGKVKCICFGDFVEIVNRTKPYTYLFIEGNLKINPEADYDELFTIMSSRVLVLQDEQMLSHRNKLDSVETAHYQSREKQEFQTYKKSELANNFESILSGDYQKEPDYTEQMELEQELDKWR